MEPYSADIEKRKDRKPAEEEGKQEVVNKLIIPFDVSPPEEKKVGVYDGLEKIRFKKRDRKYQAIFRSEFE